jgi:hypothetical protein
MQNEDDPSIVKCFSQPLATIHSRDDYGDDESSVTCLQDMSPSVSVSPSVDHSADELDDAVKTSASGRRGSAMKKRRRKPRPYFSSVLHDNHELRRMTCQAMASVVSAASTPETTLPKSEYDGYANTTTSSSVFPRAGNMLSPLPAMDEKEDEVPSLQRRVSESSEERTTARTRRISDNEMEKVFGVAELAQNLRKKYAAELESNVEEASIERDGIRMSWVV